MDSKKVAYIQNYEIEKKLRVEFESTSSIFHNIGNNNCNKLFRKDFIIYFDKHISFCNKCINIFIKILSKNLIKILEMNVHISYMTCIYILFYITYEIKNSLK